MRIRPLAVGIALAAGLTLALAGCADVGDVLQHQVRGSYDSPAALRQAWSTPASDPAWLPADSTRIRAIAATAGHGADETPAALRATTASPLPSSCTIIDRRSMDPFSVDWAPTTIPDRVERCGNWAVIRVPGGYYGWTPLTAAELAE